VKQKALADKNPPNTSVPRNTARQLKLRDSRFDWLGNYDPQ
jgi:hypothetical protein